jgi:hypothetical protein
MFVRLNEYWLTDRLDMPIPQTQEPAVLKRHTCSIASLRNSISPVDNGESHFRTRSNVWPLTDPPPMAVFTFLLNPSLFDLKSSAASLFRGSDAFGSRNKNYGYTSAHASHEVNGERQTCNPTMTALRLSTGFQSSRKILRQTFPSRSILGWYIFCVHFTFGGSCGKFWLMAKEK